MDITVNSCGCCDNSKTEKKVASTYLRCKSSDEPQFHNNDNQSQSDIAIWSVEWATAMPKNSRPAAHRGLLDLNWVARRNNMPGATKSTAHKQQS